MSTLKKNMKLTPISPNSSEEIKLLESKTDHKTSIEKSERKRKPLLPNNRPRFIAKKINSSGGSEKKKEISKVLEQITEDFESSPSLDKLNPKKERLTSPQLLGYKSSIFSEEALALANENAEFSVLNSGPRFNAKGEIIKYSIVGKPENFLKQLTNDQKSLNHFFVCTPGTTPKINPFSHFANSSGMKQRSTFNFSDPQAENISGAQHSNTSLRLSHEDSLHEERNTVLPSLPLGVSNTAASINRNGNGSDTWGTTSRFNKQIKRRFKKNELTKKDLMSEITEIEEKGKKMLEEDLQTINTLPLSDQLYFTKESRILQQFEEKEKYWSKKISQIGKTIQRENQSESIMVRSGSWRPRQEISQAFELIKSDEQIFRESLWYMTLRKYKLDKRSELKKHKTTEFENDDEQVNQRGLRGLLEKSHMMHIDDLPRAFKTSTVEKKQYYLEKIRKPMIKIEGESFDNNSKAFSTFNNSFYDDEYFQNKLSSSINDLSKIQTMVQDDELTGLYLEGENILKKEKRALLNDGNPPTSVYTKLRFIPNENNTDDKNEVYAEHYDNQKLWKTGESAFPKINLNY